MNFFAGGFRGWSGVGLLFKLNHDSNRFTVLVIIYKHTTGSAKYLSFCPYQSISQPISTLEIPKLRTILYDRDRSGVPTCFTDLRCKMIWDRPRQKPILCPLRIQGTRRYLLSKVLGKLLRIDRIDLSHQGLRHPPLDRLLLGSYGGEFQRPFNRCIDSICDCSSRRGYIDLTLRVLRLVIHLRLD